MLAFIRKASYSKAWVLTSSSFDIRDYPSWDFGSRKKKTETAAQNREAPQTGMDKLLKEVSQEGPSLSFSIL